MSHFPCIKLCELLWKGKSFFILQNSTDRKSTRLNSSHLVISYAVFCLKKKTILTMTTTSRRANTLGAVRLLLVSIRRIERPQPSHSCQEKHDQYLPYDDFLRVSSNLCQDH